MNSIGNYHKRAAKGNSAQLRSASPVARDSRRSGSRNGGRAPRQNEEQRTHRHRFECQGTQGKNGEQRLHHCEHRGALGRNGKRKASSRELGGSIAKQGAQRLQFHRRNVQHRVEHVVRRPGTAEKGVQCPEPNEKPTPMKEARTENPLKRKREPPIPSIDDDVQPPPLKKARRGLVFDLGTYNESRRAWFNWRAYVQESLYRQTMRHRKRAMILQYRINDGEVYGSYIDMPTSLKFLSKDGPRRLGSYLGSHGVSIAQWRAFGLCALHRRMAHHMAQAAEMQNCMTEAQRVTLMGGFRQPFNQR